MKIAVVGTSEWNFDRVSEQYGSNHLSPYASSYLKGSPLGIHSIFTALPVQLGLMLEDATARYEVLVIDRAEKP